jgi:predicted transcriptional regulator
VQVKAATTSVAELIGTDSRAGLIDANTGRHLTHNAIRQFLVIGLEGFGNGLVDGLEC